MSAKNITVLVGGVGGARFLRGLRSALGTADPGPDHEAHRIRAVVNVGDDIWLHGLRICPDLDTCLYTLGDGIDNDRGWGRLDESWRVSAELAAYGAEPGWFALGDRDMATHLVRSRMLRAGYRLTDIAAALSRRWQPGVELLPASDDRVETHVSITDPDSGEPRAVHFQEWWVRYGARPPARSFVSVGADKAGTTAEVHQALTGADAVILAPSNPVVSIGTALAVPGLREALRASPAPVVGISPIVGGRPLRGMADACLSAIEVETSSAGVAGFYGARAAGGLLDAWLSHTGDDVAMDGVDCRSVPLLMSSPQASAALATAALDAAGIRV